MGTDEVGLLGAFNLENITAGIAAVATQGIYDTGLIREVVSQFRGLEHRLEFVAEKEGVKYYNDSFSTTPETAVAALSAFSAPVILIVGGSEKNSDYKALARELSSRPVKALLATGKTGPKIAEQARGLGFSGRIIDTGLTDMERIVKVAAEQSSSGDVVLLSPASASFDMFTDYKHRGELFKKFVALL
jgi:UDP-N-acetylmuramoylalanine--D-glutamate ligase